MRPERFPRVRPAGQEPEPAKIAPASAGLFLQWLQWLQWCLWIEIDPLPVDEPALGPFDIGGAASPQQVHCPAPPLERLGHHRDQRSGLAVWRGARSTAGCRSVDWGRAVAGAVLVRLGRWAYKERGCPSGGEACRSKVGEGAMSFGKLSEVAGDDGGRERSCWVPAGFVRASRTLPAPLTDSWYLTGLCRAPIGCPSPASRGPWSRDLRSGRSLCGGGVRSFMAISIARLADAQPHAPCLSVAPVARWCLGQRLAVVTNTNAKARVAAPPPITAARPGGST